MGARFAHDLDWHLIECPGCGTANAANADSCWQCERPLASAPQDRAAALREATASPPKAAASSRAGNDEPSAASRTFGRTTWIAASCAGLVTAITLGLWWQDASRTDGATHAQQASRASATGAALGRTSVDTESRLRHAISSEPDASIGRSSDAYRALGLVGDDTDAERDKRGSAASAASASSGRSDVAVGCTPAIDAMGLCSPSPDPKQKR
jgi:hypothetical protein